MKNAILYSVIILISASLYSAEPLVKFYFQDGSTKQYNLREIDSLGVIDQKNNYVLRIHYDDTLVAYYPTEIIGSIKFEKNSVNRDILNVYIFGYPKTYKLSSIDSLVLYIDQWQPLTIGSKVWMLKNLNVDHYRYGDSITEVNDKSSWPNLTTGAWSYYNNSDSIGKIYGKLYNWYAVNDPRGLAPVGWHVPSDSEWTAVTTFLGCDSLAGGKLKETGTEHWAIPNTGATNESGFTALPGGCRYYDGTNHYIGNTAYWWTSSESTGARACFRYLYSNNASIFSHFIDKGNGMSVRCVKDK